MPLQHHRRYQRGVTETCLNKYNVRRPKWCWFAIMTAKRTLEFHLEKIKDFSSQPPYICQVTEKGFVVIMANLLLLLLISFIGN